MKKILVVILVFAIIEWGIALAMVPLIILEEELVNNGIDNILGMSVGTYNTDGTFNPGAGIIIISFFIGLLLLYIIYKEVPKIKQRRKERMVVSDEKSEHATRMETFVENNKRQYSGTVKLNKPIEEEGKAKMSRIESKAQRKLDREEERHRAYKLNEKALNINTKNIVLRKEIEIRKIIHWALDKPLWLQFIAYRKIKKKFKRNNIDINFYKEEIKKYIPKPIRDKLFKDFDKINKEEPEEKSEESKADNKEQNHE